MVCIGGEPINQGGCGSSVTKGWKIKEDGTKEQIEIKNNDIIIFKDTYPSANPNHQFDGGSVESWADTIYEVRGAAGGGFSECEIVEKKCYNYSGTGAIDCNISCPSGKWLISGGTSGWINWMYPETSGEAGTWYVNARPSDFDGNYFYKIYALCCK